MSLGGEARLHLRAHRYGVLSTNSLAVEGYPFGSLTPFVLDAQARPVIMVSRLAEHTRNITADPRVSLLVHAHGTPAGEVQSDARVTLLGKAFATGKADDVCERYLRYFPAARRYLELDFDFYRIEPATLRVVAGFGKVHWISREAFFPPANSLAESENDIITHMNSDHARQLVDCCRHYHQCTAETPRMIGMDCDGFDVRVEAQILRFNFVNCVSDAGQARAALVEMAAKACAP